MTGSKDYFTTHGVWSALRIELNWLVDYFTQTPMCSLVIRWRKHWRKFSPKVWIILSIPFSWKLTASGIDEDMNAMHLSDRKNCIERQPHDHEELELLLESFSKQVEEIVNEAENIEVTCTMLCFVVAFYNLSLEQCPIYSRNCRAHPGFEPQCSSCS